MNSIIVYGGKPIVPDENYDGGFYILNLSKSATIIIIWFELIYLYKLIDTKQWNRIQLEGNQPSERWGHSAVANDGIMYIWGGQQEGNYFNDLFIFNSSTCELNIAPWYKYRVLIIIYSQFSTKMGAIELQQRMSWT